MKLGSPALERALRRRIRGELRSSKELWREYRAHRKRARPAQINWVGRLVVPLIALAPLTQGKPQINLLLVILMLYATGSAFLRAVSLLRGLYASQPLVVLAHLPMSDDDFFRLQWGRFVRSSLWMLWAFVGILGSTIVMVTHGARGLELAVVLALAEWILLLGTASAVAAWGRRFKLLGVGQAFCGAAILLWFVGRLASPTLESSLGSALLSLPAGWICVTFEREVLGNAPGAWVWALPSLAGLVLFAAARRHLRRTYHLRELVFARPAAEMILEREIHAQMDLRTGEEAQAPLRPSEVAQAREEFLRSLPMANEERIRDRGFLQPKSWAGLGMLERVFDRWLSTRERGVAELMLGTALNLTRKWKITMVASMCGIGLALGAGPHALLPLLGIAALLGLLALDANWPGFRIYNCAGKFMPAHATYPASYAEVSRIYFKMAVIRILAWVPLAVAYGAAAGAASPLLGGARGMVLALKVGWLVTVAQPLVMGTRYSAGTSETNLVSFRGCFGLVLPLVVFLLPLIGAAIGVLALPPVYALASGAGAFLLSLAFWAFYGRMYERYKIDVIRSLPSGAVAR